MNLRIRFSRICSLMLALPLIIGLLGTSAAIADSIYTSDCTNLVVPKSVFDKNETICVSGTVNNKINPFDFFPCADVYIVDNKSWSVGDTFTDAMGVPNRICSMLLGGAFFDEVIALPPKVKVGRFDLIMDTNQNAKLDPWETVENPGPGWAFEVVDLGHPPVDMSPLKNAANSIGMGYSNAIQQWNDAMAILDAASIGLSLMSGDVIGAAIGVVSHFTGVPTDYNGWVIYYATEMIGGYDPNSTPKKASGIYGNMAKHWADLAADPPDANFKVFAPLDTAAIMAELKATSIPGTYPDAYPIQPLGSNPREAALIRIANRGIEQGALVKAMRQSYEKYQGAAAVTNYEFAYRQLEAARSYGDLLAANLADYKADLLNLKAVLITQGMADKVIDVSGLQALKDRMNTTGITPEEIASLKAVGFSDARIALLVDYTKVMAVPPANYTLGNSIDTLVLKTDQTIAAIQTANTNAQTAMATMVKDFTPHYPTARAGGPYTGVTGSQITLDGGLSTHPDVGVTLTYAWDLNGDGIFTDALGKVVLYTWNKPFTGLIGLKVTDPAGNSSIGYAKVTITAGNLPPVITSFSPSETNPRASVLHPLTLSVTAIDPEGGPLTYEWTVDGVSAGTGTSFTFTPPANTKGTKRVMVAVRDNQPNNRAAIDGRLVTMYIDCDPSDPTTMTTYYRDADGDGFGNPNITTLACSQPAGYVTNNLDCNDSNPAIGPATQKFHRDADNDGYGNPNVWVIACSAPAGYVANNLDCDDSNPLIGPATQKFYRDADGDGFGDPNVWVIACSAPAGYVANNLDCNDHDPTIGNNKTTYYRDADGDGFGDPHNTILACLAPAGYVANGLDCNDANPFINPGMKEIPNNGKDDDCNPATPDNWSKSFVLGIDDASWIYYAKSNGDGTFSNYRTLDYLGSYYSRGITIEDFNNDGYLDFIAGRGDGSLFLFLNDGNDNFINKGIVATHPNPGGYIMDMAAGDFNNDGLPDFIANGNSNVLAVFINDGKGGFTRSTITLPYYGRGLDVADFNGDGNLDFAVSLSGTNDVWVYTGDGTGKFVGAKIGTATTSASDNYALAAADFDNDGKPDIIVSGSSNGDAYFFKGNGDGTFQPGVLVPSLNNDKYYSSMDAYDLNNDGNVDIVMGNYGSNNKLWFYPGNGNGTFGPRTAISPAATRGTLLAVSAPPTSNRAAGFPVADAQPKSQTVAVGANAILNGSYSYDPKSTITAYNWNFGDGTSTTGALATHPYATEGRFLATLSVTDNNGKKNTDSAQVIVKGNPPVANAGGPYLVGEASATGGRYTVNLDGSASTDDYGIVSYEWEMEAPLYDNFNAGNANGWTPAGGAWSVSGGAYLQSDINVDRTDTFTGSPKSGDYTIEADVMLLSGTGQEAQLLFRGADANNHYEFILRGRGINDVLLYRQQNGGFAQLAQYYLPFAIQNNVWYHLKIEAYGSKIRLYVNDSLAIDYGYATEFSNGMVGFSTYRTSAKFDNLKVNSFMTGAKPTRIYLEGTYNVKLTVTDKAGQKATATTTVSAIKGNPPVANPGGPYVQDETKANANTWTINFDGSGSTDDTGIEFYSWDFGDGATGTGVKPSHIYTGVGTRAVTLTVTDRSGQSNTKTTTVTTKGNAPPVANTGGPYNVTENLVVNRHWTINADASASTDDVGIWKYEWNFGDGSPVATTKITPHTYATPGTYTVSLKVTDHANQSSTATTTTSVVGTGVPTANAGGPYVTEPNTPVNFDGSASTDNTGILSYRWNFGDGTTGKGATPVHAYSATGSYTVTLTVPDTALQTATATAAVSVVVGNPPVANAGGPYKSNVGVPVRLNGSGSTDDYGIASYEWAVGAANSLLKDSFTGTVIDTANWLFPASGVTQNGAVTLTGGGGWGSRYLFSKNDFPLDGIAVVTGQVIQTADGYLMFGFKNTNTNFSYDQMPYALYFANGTFQIYENGSYRVQGGSYSLNVLYDVKVELKTSYNGGIGGAKYYYKQASSPTWILVYDSNYVPASATFKAGVSYYGGTFVIDNLSLTNGQQILYGEKPVVVPTAVGVLPVQLTVRDGAGQSSIASSTLTVSSDPLVITLPWQISGGLEVPHDTWSGAEVTLKAVVKSGRAPITYSWNFGDGTSSAPATVTDSYNLSAKHTYTAMDGTPFTARITVTDADGKSSSDTFPIIVRPKTLNVEVNKAIDDALWYIHTSQDRTGGATDGRWSGYSSYYSSPTASALHAMEINGHLEIGDFSNDPYVEDVWRGMSAMLKSIRQAAITDQAYGDPDQNGNGIGIEVVDGNPIYQGGQVMMALVASGTPNMKAPIGGAGIMGRTYRDIVEDMAEMYYWGQGDDEWGYGAGGWRYGWQGQGDNSASQWAALGLEAAEEQSWIKVPQWVRDRNIVWLAYSRNGDGNGYGYAGPGNGEATTPSGLAQVAFDKIPTTDSRWKQAENFLASYWNNWYNGTGNYYALYALAKAMRTAKPKEITILGEGTANAIDWYNDPTRGVARTIVNQQDANGMFTGGGGSKWVEGGFRTAWGVIILTKTLFVLPPVAIAGNNMVWGINWPLTFDGSKSYHLDPFRKIVKYEWDFDGDGIYDSSSDQPTATHTYAQLGTYKVTLRVTDNNVPPKYDTNTITVIVAVPPHPPIANPGGPYVGYTGIPVQLDGSKSYDIDPTDFITSYGWELDNVYPYNFADATGAKPTYTWNSPGTYNIGLQVYDNGVLSPNNQKLSDTKWTTITIKLNHPPVASAGGPYTVNEGSTIQLDGSASTDLDGNPLTYAWDLDNDGIFETAGAKPSFSRPDNGVFTVRLKVSDGALESTASTTVTVLNVPPAVNPLSPVTLNEGGTYTASGSFTDPGADTWTATVDYGDGTGVQPLPLSGKTFALSHIYPRYGGYTVTVTVTDKDGGIGSGSALVTVNNVAPIVNAGPGASINAGGAFISAGSFTDPGKNSWVATVDYGDGTGVQPLTLNPDKTFALSHPYAQQGSYTVTVTVKDDGGGTGSNTAVVMVSIPTCLTSLSARAKTGMVQLNWSATEHTPTTLYDIYRSTAGPSSGFTKIRSGYTNLYPVFVDTGLTNGTTYWYRIEKSLAPAAPGYCSSIVVSGKPMALL